MLDNHDRIASMFKGICANVVVNSRGGKMATINFKRNKTTAAMTCVLHVMSFAPVITRATGYGYDKQASALNAAIRNFANMRGETRLMTSEFSKLCETLDAIEAHDGCTWQHVLHDAGFNVITAIDA